MKNATDRISKFLFRSRHHYDGLDTIKNNLEHKDSTDFNVVFMKR